MYIKAGNWSSVTDMYLAVGISRIAARLRVSHSCCCSCITGCDSWSRNTLYTAPQAAQPTTAHICITSSMQHTACQTWHSIYAYMWSKSNYNCSTLQCCCQQHCNVHLLNWHHRLTIASKFSSRICKLLYQIHASSYMQAARRQASTISTKINRHLASLHTLLAQHEHT